VSAAAVYLSGVVPLRAIADHTVIGRQVVEFVKSTGRGSFTWRIARDQRALPVIAEHPLVGSGRWDWWRKNGERPWGLVLLIIGQFGLIGLALAFGSLLAPVARTITSHWHPGAWRMPSVALATIVLMGIADALLNSFFFYPAILAAGAAAFPFPAPSRQLTDHPRAVIANTQPPYHHLTLRLGETKAQLA